MFASLRLRSEVALQALPGPPSLQYRLLFPARFANQNNDMAERPSTTQDYYSTASAPSLRGNQPMEMMDRPRSSDGDANVKVVVRVRKFIKRGMREKTCNVNTRSKLTGVYRHREKVQMHRSHDPRDARDTTARA